MSYRGKKNQFQTSLELSDHLKLHSPIHSNLFFPSIDAFPNVEMTTCQTHPLKSCTFIYLCSVDDIQRQKKNQFQTSLELSDHLKLHSPIHSNMFFPSIDAFPNVEMTIFQTHPLKSCTFVYLCSVDDIQRPKKISFKLHLSFPIT